MADPWGNRFRDFRPSPPIGTGGCRRPDSRHPFNTGGRAGADRLGVPHGPASGRRPPVFGLGPLLGRIFRPCQSSKPGWPPGPEPGGQTTSRRWDPPAHSRPPRDESSPAGGPRVSVDQTAGCFAPASCFRPGTVHFRDAR